jgi:ribonuclease J
MVLIGTGSLGEPMAALSRMANREHIIKVGEGDTILLASSLIPGNENAIYGVINGLIRWGATVVHKGNAKVHVSGHASAGELTYCYNIVKPKNVLPVHGEWRHLTANADLAIATGVPEDRVLVVEDGVVVDLDRGRASIAGRIPAPYVFVDGATIGVATEDALKDRLSLAEEGHITVLGIFDEGAQKLVDPVEFIPRGFVEAAGWEKQAEDVAEKALQQATARGKIDGEAAEQAIEDGLSRWFLRRHRRTPVITTVVVDAD